MAKKIETLSKHEREQNLIQMMLEASTSIGALPRLVTAKRQVATNALTHGLTGEFLHLPPAKLVSYLRFGIQIFEDMRPVGIREVRLAQRFIDAQVRYDHAIALQRSSDTSNMADESRGLLRANPFATEEDVAPIAESEGLQNKTSSLLDKLGRYETRLERSMDRTEKNLEEKQARRIRRNGDKDVYDKATCPGHQWYTEILEVARQLVRDHNEEVKRDRARIDKRIEQIKAANAPGAPPATPRKLKASDETLFRRILLQTTGPISPEAEATLAKLFPKEAVKEEKPASPEEMEAKQPETA